METANNNDVFSPVVKSTMDLNPDCTVVVCSCDKYVDLLGPFITLYRKFWPDCPFKTVLVTESDPQINGFDRIIACGSGMNWASRLEKSLGEISTPYVLMLCDDYFLEDTVKTACIMSRLSQAKSLDAVNLRLIPNPVPISSNSTPAEFGLFEYRKNTAYCIATQAGIWNREFLRELVRGKSSIWEFERYGSFEVGDMARRLLVTPEREFPFIDAVHKGYWEKFGLAICQKNGMEVDFRRRSRPPIPIRIKEWLKTMVFAVFPVSLIVRVQNALGVGAREKGSGR